MAIEEWAKEFKSYLVELQLFRDDYKGIIEYIDEGLAMLKEHKNEYENGFNDAMLDKQELMYEGIDGKWHKKDW